MKILKQILAVLGVTSVLAIGGGAMAAPAHAQAQVAAGCTQVDIRAKDGRVLMLWKCNNSLHGQVTQASGGDLVYMQTTGGATAGGGAVPAGGTSANSGAVSSGTWRACLAVHDRPGQDWCTGFYRV